MPNQKNKDTVKALEEKIKNNPNLVITSYMGLTTPEINDLRAKLKPVNCQYSVVKNTLTEIALKNCGLEQFSKHLSGPTAVAFQKGDPAGLAKAIVEFAKSNEKMKILAAYLDGRTLTDKELKVLATLPSREVLLAKLAGTMKGPIQQIATVLNAPIQKMALVLKALEQQKAKAAA